MDIGRDLERGLDMFAEINEVERRREDEFVRNGKKNFEGEVMIRTMLFSDESEAKMADMSTESGIKYMKMITLLRNPGG